MISISSHKADRRQLASCSGLFSALFGSLLPRLHAHFADSSIPTSPMSPILGSSASVFSYRTDALCDQSTEPHRRSSRSPISRSHRWSRLLTGRPNSSTVRANLKWSVCDGDRSLWSTRPARVEISKKAGSSPTEKRLMVPLVNNEHCCVSEPSADYLYEFVWIRTNSYELKCYNSMLNRSRTILVGAQGSVRNREIEFD